MKPFADYTKHDALGLADLVRRKEVHPEELVEAAIERIERFNPALNAVIDKLYDRARRAAREPLPDGPFAGVPYLLKDMVAHAGTRLTLGTMLLKQVGYTPKKSHEVIARSERAGLIVVGKTNACELGLLPVTEPRAFGPTANPWRLHHSPGGSSGGSAAAVAAGLVPLAHGNDGGGSIRIPASCCGVFGFKPSRGRNPGHADDSPDGLTTEHCLSRSVRDSAALLDVTRGPRSGDRWWAPAPSRPYLQEVSVDPAPLRIAFSTCDLLGRRAHPDCCEAVQRAAALCERLGHKVQEAQPAIDGQRFNELFTDLWVTMAAAIYHLFMRYVRRRRALALAADVLGDRRVLEVLGRLQLRSLESPFEPGTHAAAKLGEKLSHAQFYGTASELQRMSFELADFFRANDVWLTPVLAEPPLRTGELASLSLEELRERTLAYAAYTPLCNAAGVPAMSLPLHHNGAGLPIGVHFAGRFGDEATLFQLAGQIERAEPWADRWPDLVRV